MMGEDASSAAIERLRSIVGDLLVEQGLPSISIAVAQGGSIVWEDAFGWADRERRIPATPHTLYSLASITKPITATGIMLLRERGRLDLDHPIEEYLGGARLGRAGFDPATVTVRQVAAHRAGLPLHWQFFFTDEAHQPPAMAETIRRYGNLVTPPGERYQYSNLGYGILGEVIVRQSRKTYADFMREEVFVPLGMTRAAIGVPTALAPYTAQRYGKDQRPLTQYVTDHPGASDAYVSAHDLARFGMFHLNEHLPDQRAILSDAALAAMREPFASVSPGQSYGIGWGITDRKEYRNVSHNGGMEGVRTSLLLYPDARLAVVVLCNINTDAVGTLAEDIAAAFLPGYDTILAEQRAEAQRKKLESEHTPPFEPPAGLVGTWAGTIITYSETLPWTLWVLPSGDIHSLIGEQLMTLVNNAHLDDGRLTGEMVGDIQTDDANRRAYHLHLDLAVRDDVLNGALIAIDTNGYRDALAVSRPAGFALSSWAELHREA